MGKADEKSRLVQDEKGDVNFQGMVEAANSIVMSLDQAGRVTYINPFGLAFFGFDKAEILGRSPLDTIVPERFSNGMESFYMTEIINDPVPYASHTNENIKKDGTRVWVSWTNKGIFDSQGELREILSVGNDITRIKEMEAELFTHRRNLESLVSERTRALASATERLTASQNRLMLLNTISTCIIQDRSTHFTVGRVLEQLTGMFKSCGAAFISVSPGATLLTIDQAHAPSPLPDITGVPLDVARARPFFRDLIHNFKPYVFSDTAKSLKNKGLDEFVAATGIRSGMAIPLQDDLHLMGLIFIYCQVPRQWPEQETELMEQVGEALAVALGHRENKERLVAQEQFLENVFEGVDIGIFVLSIKENGMALFEKMNQAYESLRGITQARTRGTTLDSLGKGMASHALEALKARVAQCIQKRMTIRFLEETGKGDEKKTWLTRLSPVEDDGGRVFRIIGASTDISEQKQVESDLVKNQARLRKAQRIAKLGDFERDIHTMALSCSDEIRRIFGWDNGFCPGLQDFMERLHPEDREYVSGEIGRVVAENSAYDLEYRILGRNGDTKILNEIGEAVKDGSGQVCKITGIVQDVTEQKAFRDEIELARKVFDNAVEGVVVTDRDGTIEFVNKGFTTITGFSEDDALGNNPRMLKSDRHDQTFYKDMWAALEREGHWSGEIWNRRKNGEAYPEWLSITAITDRRGETMRYMSVFHDLSDIREREAQLSFQANYDALTGLPNRTLLLDRIQMAVRRMARGNNGLAVIFLDMDDFKHVNDTLGHAKGDMLLQQFASRMLAAVREQDTVARYGGDEFIILLPDTNDTDIVIQVIERIKNSLEAPFIVGTKEFFLRVSIGVTLSPQDGTSPDTLISNADMAMYRSKDLGKGRYAFFTSELNRQVARRVELEMDLRQALAREEFTLYFQPKLDIRSNRISGVEALIRWEHPEKGIVSPGEFIPLAEETGLINPMGEWILDQACIRTKEWSKALNRHFTVAVNISSRQVRDVDLVSQVSDALKRHQLPPDCLELEITESAVMGNVEKAKTMFNNLHGMGINISIDDFGTGFSSLSYLRLFPVSVLKIDKSFVDDIPGDRDSNTMVTTIITMARHLNLVTVAEGVEEKAQLEFLRENRCDQIQGYYFSRPMPGDNVLTFLKTHE